MSTGSRRATRTAEIGVVAAFRTTSASAGSATASRGRPRPTAARAGRGRDHDGDDGLGAGWADADDRGGAHLVQLLDLLLDADRGDHPGRGRHHVLQPALDPQSAGRVQVPDVPGPVPARVPGRRPLGRPTARRTGPSRARPARTPRR